MQQKTFSKRLLVTSETAALLRTTRGVLANLRCHGEGPPYIKMGKRVLYDVEEIEEWIGRRKVKTIDTVCHEDTKSRTSMRENREQGTLDDKTGQHGSATN